MSKDNCFFNKECKTNKFLFLMHALIVVCVLSILVFAPDYAFAEDGKGDSAPAEEFVGPQSDAELLSIVTLNDNAYLPSNQDGWQESSRGTQYYKNGIPVTGWLVDATYKNYGLQRYFFDADAYLVKNRAITSDEAGYWAYARPEGYVVRGVYDNGAARVFLADNDGRLPDDEGWFVTGQYTGGSLQRYYIDDATHGAKTAFFDVDDNRYWGEGGCGYVLRGNDSRGGKLVSADNDGKLLKQGWLCTADYGQGFQRYWFSDFSVPTQGVYQTDSSSWTYVTGSGPVLRGIYDNGAARVYLANNDGVLASQEGWLVTGDYTGGSLQRYYIDGEAHAAKTSFFEVGGNKYWGEGGCGYVLRGCGIRSGQRISADNDGKLLKDGWLCTDAFGQGFQRYWFKDYSVPAEGYYVVSGSANAATYTYVTASGYVLRGTHDNGAGRVFLGDNDGILASTPGWLVTGTYAGGVLQRYYIDSEMPAAKTSIFDVGGSKYFGLGGVGYVLRGTMDNGAGRVFLADNDGILASTPGWLVTDKYAGSIQRYYIDSAMPAAITSFFTVDGKDYYGQGGVGYVVRGKYKLGAGILLANNEGALETNEGWLVTSAYDGQIERYRMDHSCNGHIGAHCGAFTIDGHLYYGRDDQGYVVRNDYVWINGVLYHADNDGICTKANPPGTDRMVAMCNNYSSPTGMLLMVDLSTHKVGVFTGAQGSWNLVAAWDCSCGAPATPTVTGVFSVGSKGYSFGSGYTCYYWTQFYGNYLFHSILYRQGTFDVLDGRLGQSISHGCVRLAIECAQWIYSNAPTGTTVVTFN